MARVAFAILMAKLSLAMVGGGVGAFIGPVQRMAAELDGDIALVAGAFSSDATRSAAAGRAYGVAPERAYGSYEALIAGEVARDDRARLISVVTPNHLHLPVAEAALNAGPSVISDKPAAATLAEALQLRETIKRTGGLYALTFTYTGAIALRHRSMAV